MRKRKWLIPAILLTLLSCGAVQETARIYTSDAQDIVKNRKQLKPMATVLTFGLLVGAGYCWYRKATS